MFLICVVVVLALIPIYLSIGSDESNANTQQNGDLVQKNANAVGPSSDTSINDNKIFPLFSQSTTRHLAPPQQRPTTPRVSPLLPNIEQLPFLSTGSPPFAQNQASKSGTNAQEESGLPADFDPSQFFVTESPKPSANATRKLQSFRRRKPKFFNLDEKRKKK